MIVLVTVICFNVIRIRNMLKRKSDRMILLKKAYSDKAPIGSVGVYAQLDPNYSTLTQFQKQ